MVTQCGISHGEGLYFPCDDLDDQTPYDVVASDATSVVVRYWATEMEMHQMNKLVLVASAVLWLRTGTLPAQTPLSLAKVVETLEKDGRVALDNGNVLAFTYDYSVDGDKVEAIAFRPTADGKYPAVLLIPGFSKTARDYIPLGLRFAREGFACVAVTQRGFGTSAGKPDFVGPKTIAALNAGFQQFRNEPYVDGSRMGLFGYSRGAMAASLLAVRLKDEELRAAVFAAGIYDFKKAYDDVMLPGIRENMEQEAGLSDAAARDRTSATKMADLPCPVLILHGEKDENAPVSQAYLLRDRLTGLKKDFELKTFPDKDHDLGRQNLYDHTFEFFKRKLTAEKPER
jgi:dipeptidyl aminopeptidase/acylaminoacyl peptidase